jgi:hypothetical protein
MRPAFKTFATVLAGLLMASCAKQHAYHNANMDFASVRTVAVMPFWNLSKEPQAADRVRDVLQNSLLATNAVYVIPTGEVSRAVTRLGIAVPVTPSPDEVVKLCAMLKADAVITGVLKEYGEIRTSSAASNIVAMSLQMQESSTGKIIWSGASTRGGVGWGARLLGSTGGRPVNDVTEAAVDDLLDQLFK